MAKEVNESRDETLRRLPPGYALQPVTYATYGQRNRKDRPSRPSFPHTTQIKQMLPPNTLQKLRELLPLPRRNKTRRAA